MPKEWKHEKSAEKFYLGFQNLLNCCMISLYNFCQTTLDFVSVTNSKLAKYLDMNTSLFSESLILTSVEEIMYRSNLSPSRYFLGVPWKTFVVNTFYLRMFDFKIVFYILYKDVAVSILYRDTS